MHRNKYKKWYDALMENARRRPIPSGYVERHHVIPRSLGGSNRKTNIVVLTAREHYVAHLLLCRIHTGIEKHKMLRALVRFAVKAGREFEIARTIIAREYTGSGNPSYGKRWSHHPETGEVAYGRALPQDHVLGLPSQRGGHRGFIWINDGTQESMVERANDLPQGWVAGRLNRPDIDQLRKAAKARHTTEKDEAHRQKMLGRVRIYHPDTGTVKKVHVDQVDTFLTNGWTTQSIAVKNSKACCVYGVVYATLAAAARAHGVSDMTVAYRIKNEKWPEWMRKEPI